MSTPLYRRIAAELRHAISRGELPPGGQLPTEQELGDRYKVSRNTVRLALGLLTNEGIITSTPGRGTFVRDRIMPTSPKSASKAANPASASTCASIPPPSPSPSACGSRKARPWWSGA